LNAKEGTTLVLVTHDPKLAARCQRQVEMDSGILNEKASAVVAESVDVESTSANDVTPETSTSQVG